jgi:hypothetical protein
MAHTRAKFQCHHVTDHGHNKSVRLAPVYSRKEGTENYDFTKATPSGELTMSIDNPAAAVQFKPLRMYYLDIHECAEEQQSYGTDGVYKGFEAENLNPKAS